MAFCLTLQDTDLPKMEDIALLPKEYKASHNPLTSQVHLSITHDNHTIGGDEVGTEMTRHDTLNEKYKI